jgi:hypothetical protein
METINRAHATIVNTIKGSEALEGGNHAVYEVIAQYAPQLAAYMSMGMNLTRHTDCINKIVSNLPRQSNDTVVPALTAEQINTVAAALDDRQIAIANDVLLSPGRVSLERHLAAFDESLKTLFAS